MIKSNGGVFGRNPTFQDVTVDGNLTVNGDLALGDDITINDTLLVNGVATFKGGIVSTGTAAAPTSNTVMGSGAGAALQAGGTNNVLLGSSAGAAITTEDNVVAIGFNAANLNTANDTVAIGSGALDANTTGANNTAVGRNALGANTTGQSNTAVGNGALSGNTTGEYNSAIGLNALGGNTTASGNLAVGAFALLSTSTSGNNVAVGPYCLQSSTGSSNSGFGHAALFPLASGTQNVAIGDNAGRYRGSSTDSLTVASQSVFIGYQSRAAADSQSNQVVIAGTNGLGNGSNTTTIGNSSTTGTFIPAGNLTLTNGNFIVGTSGKGIDFSATANSSGTMTSELLNDYEEGTFTPALTYATPGDAVFTASEASGRYVKVGKVVHVQIYCTGTLTQTTASGVLLMTGFPFAAENQSGGYSAMTNCVYFQGITKANYTSMGLRVDGSSRAEFRMSGSGQNAATVVVADVTGNPYISVMFTYEAD